MSVPNSVPTLDLSMYQGSTFTMDFNMCTVDLETGEPNGPYNLVNKTVRFQMLDATSADIELVTGEEVNSNGSILQIADSEQEGANGDVIQLRLGANDLESLSAANEDSRYQIQEEFDNEDGLGLIKNILLKGAILIDRR